ncbi:NADH-quinone oxidoreductase subunit L [Caldinitratiruptor microaerophilus]|uniref:NADH-quinone oxidoreductase subunit L n=1 Tax=Caldinitratiruptor microaerophilus TaxID=671077 RepID=A0AA35CI40_9FIRM|nr:NADH-quinone oxidoreductase subunit L [Caldinitratiruptor microaerophilus]BDG59459.1 NADH-quinone oxidoreductase subunit L [Caldinitratiruptor microaerophilus]
MHDSLLPVLILIPPLLGAAVIAGRTRYWRSAAAIGVLASAMVLVAFGFTLGAFVELQRVGPDAILRTTLTSWEIGGHRYQMGLMIDQLSMWWLLVVTGVGFLIHAYSTGYMHGDPDYGRYFAKLNYFVFAMSLLVMANNFLTLVIGWTNVGLASYLLIGFYRTRPAANAAQIKAYVVNLIGEVFMLTGIGAAVARYATVDFWDVAQAARFDPPGATVIALLVLVGAVAKSAQMPLHVWLPDAMQGPTPVSAMLHAATMVTAGVYIVARLFPMFQAAPVALAAVAVVGAASALLGAIFATRQYDIKKVLAYSTLSQIGYMFLANGVGAHAAAAFHFATHAFFKAALFLGAGIIIHALHGEQDIRRMGGLSRRMPFAFATFLAGQLALVGIPPFAGFFSKDEILAAAWNSGHYVLWAVGLLAAGFTALYNMRLLGLVFLGRPYDVPATAARSRGRKTAGAGHDAHAGHGALHPIPLSMNGVVGVLAVLSVVGGAALAPFVEPYLEPVFVRNRVFEVSTHAALWSVLVTLAVIAAGLAAGWWLWGPNGVRREAEQRTLGEPAGVLGRAFYFDELYDLVAVQPAFALSDWARNFDLRRIDGVLHALAGLAQAGGAFLGRLHGGIVRRYALTLVTGVVLIAAYFALYL